MRIGTWRRLYIQTYSIELSVECVDIKSAKKCTKAKQNNKCNKKTNAEKCAKTCGYCETGKIDMSQPYSLSSVSLHLIHASIPLNSR